MKKVIFYILIMPALVFAQDEDLQRRIFPLHEALGEKFYGDTKVFIIADVNHQNPAIATVIANSFAVFKQKLPSLDCVILETDKTDQKIYDQFESIPPQQKEAFLKEAALTGKLSSEDVMLLKSADSAGLHMLAGDIDFSSSLGKEIVKLVERERILPNDQAVQKQIALLLMEKRTKLFAEEIHNKLSNKACKHILAVTGYGHVTEHYNQTPIQSLQESLRQKAYLSAVAVTLPVSCPEPLTEDCKELKREPYVLKSTHLDFGLPYSSRNLFEFLLIVPSNDSKK